MFLWIFATFASLIALAWVALAARSVRYARSAGFLEADLTPLPSDIPAIDAVIPARNEEKHLLDTLANLQVQTYPRLTITVVDDQSTDATAEVLAQAACAANLPHPIRPVRGTDRPEGWVGKTWALYQGVQHTTADWLWFVDADMGLDPSALATAYLEAMRKQADVVTLAPRAHCQTFWQRVMALTLTHLLGQLYPASRVKAPEDSTALAVGGFILVRRDAYQRAGGHEAVREEIVDDINLARLLKSTGARICLRAAPTLASTHMYGSFSEIWRGLRKNAYAGMNYQPHKLLVGSFAALVMAWTPLAAALAGAVGHLAAGWPFAPSLILLLSGSIGWFAQALAAAPFGLFLILPVEYLATLPIGMTVYVAIAASSAWHYHRGRVLWKDRAFAAPRV